MGRLLACSRKLYENIQMRLGCSSDINVGKESIETLFLAVSRCW